MTRQQWGLAVSVLLAGQCAHAATTYHRIAWTDDPATTATIGWQQTSGEHPYLRYGHTENDTHWMTFANDAIETTSFTHPDDDSPITTQLARLTELSPDTAYYYQICDSDGCAPTEWFKTAPNTPKQFTFIAGGDSRTNRQPRQVGNRLVAKVRPLFVMFNGDFTDDGSRAQWDAWFQDWQLTQSTDGRMYPIVATHGNHENDVVDMLSYLFGIPKKGYYGLNIGGEMMRIFTLNTETEPGVGYGQYRFQDARIWNEQRDWLATDAAASDAIWKVANYHRPLRPHTRKKREGKRRLTEWGPLFTQTGFDLIVESDTHMAKYTFPVVYDTTAGSYESFKRDDTQGAMIIGEGSWGAPTRPTDDDKPWTMDSGSFWQFKLIHAAPSQFDIHTVRFGSEEEARAGHYLDATKISALTQAEQDAEPFAIPSGLPLWKPLSGEKISLAATHFAGAAIDKIQLISAASRWKYWDKGEPDTNWETEQFNDSAWASGLGPFGYGNGGEATHAEVKHNPYPTAYFRRTFSVDSPEKIIKLTMRLARDDGAIVYINGQEILRSNMPSGLIDHTSYALTPVGGSAERRYHEYPLLTNRLKSGKNTIAVAIHQRLPQSIDMRFDMDLVAVVSNTQGELPTELTTQLSATPVSPLAVKLNWVDDARFDEVGYQLERKRGAGQWKIVTWRIDANTTSYTDSGLRIGQYYHYRIRPFNAVGLAPASNKVAVKPHLFTHDKPQ